MITSTQTKDLSLSKTELSSLKYTLELSQRSTTAEKMPLGNGIQMKQNIQCRFCNTDMKEYSHI